MKSKKENKKEVVKKKPDKTKMLVTKKITKKAGTKTRDSAKTKVKPKSAAKATKPAAKPKAERIKLAKKTTTEPKTAKKETKKFFPKDAKPSAPPAGALEPKVVSKRTPWMKKPIENPHSTPAGPCINLKDLFDNYLDKKYKKIKDEQRHALWKKVSLQMLSEPFSRLNEIIDSHLSKK